jgi:hypothetical protein
VPSTGDCPFNNQTTITMLWSRQSTHLCIDQSGLLPWDGLSTHVSQDMEASHQVTKPFIFSELGFITTQRAEISQWVKQRAADRAAGL